jgi:hypothetical protein
MSKFVKLPRTIPDEFVYVDATQVFMIQPESDDVCCVHFGPDKMLMVALSAEEAVEKLGWRR